MVQLEKGMDGSESQMRPMGHMLHFASQLTITCQLTTVSSLYNSHPYPKCSGLTGVSILSESWPIPCTSEKQLGRSQTFTCSPWRCIQTQKMLGHNISEVDVVIITDVDLKEKSVLDEAWRLPVTFRKAAGTSPYLKATQCNRMIHSARVLANVT